MYVKIVNQLVSKESYIYECDQVKFKKIVIDSEDNKENGEGKAGVFNTVSTPPKNKPKYEAILLTLNHSGEIKRLLAPEATMFVLNSSGKTIDVMRCEIL